MRKKLAITLLLSALTPALADVWQRPLTTKRHPPGGGAAPIIKTYDAAPWQRIDGCAQEITAGRAGQVLVVGCDGIDRSAFIPYAFNGQGFAPWPHGGRVQAVATDGDTFYAIGADRMLWRSGLNEPWNTIGTPNGQPITDVAAGKAGLWVLTSEPGGAGGNKVSRSQPCAAGPNQLFGGGHCHWLEEPGALIRIAVGDTAWGIANGGSIWRHDGQNWQPIPNACAVDIAANGRHVYVVGCNPGPGDGHLIYRWNGREFVPTQGAGKRVAVDAAGQPWAITDSHQIWRQQR